MSNYLIEVAASIREAVGESAVAAGDADALFRIYAVLALAKGAATAPEDVHNAWVAWVSATNPDHESARPYFELDEATRKQDDVFLRAVHDVASRL
jgi:ketosteroid isomerase-like protein